MLSSEETEAFLVDRIVTNWHRESAQITIAIFTSPDGLHRVGIRDTQLFAILDPEHHLSFMFKPTDKDLKELRRVCAHA